MSVSAVKVRTIRDRDGERCAACNRYGLQTVLTTQHRANRQMGGSSQRDGYENLLTLCGTCNTRLEQGAGFAEEGRDKGWKLRTWEDAFTVAVWFSWAQEWRLLDGVGGFAVVTHRDPGERARAMDEWSRE